MMQRVDNPEQDISTTWRKFSEVWAVASRNSLYRILAISVALGARQRAKSSSQAPLYVLGWGGEGGDCYCELPRIPLLGNSVNKGKRKGRGFYAPAPPMAGRLAGPSHLRGRSFAGHLGVVLCEHPLRVVLPDPCVQVVVNADLAINSATHGWNLRGR